MVQCKNDVLLSQSVYERCHSTPLLGLVSILFHTATLHLSHFFLYLFAFIFLHESNLLVDIGTAVTV